MSKPTTSLTRRRPGGLTKYSPKKGMQRIAGAEVAEKYYRKARNMDGLEKAIRAKLTAQAELVFWWDTQANKFKGGDQRNRSVTLLVAGSDGLPDRMTLSRWRKRLGLPEAFERTYQDAIEKAVRFCEGLAAPHVAENSGENDWHTPDDLLESARKILGGIDLDPASSAVAQERVQATRYFDKSSDGLLQPWEGRVWLNPPYSVALIEKFIEKAIAHDGPTLVLTNNATETQWGQALLRASAVVCFPDKRVRFLKPSGPVGAPLQGQMLCGLRIKVPLFRSTLLERGVIAIIK